MSKEKNTPNEMEKKIEGWKKQFGEVHKLKVTDPEDEAKVYEAFVKKPSKTHMSIALPHINTNPVKAAEILFENCLIECDPEIKAKDECYLAASMQMVSIFKIAKVEVEKL